MQTTFELTRETMKVRTEDAPPGRPAGHRILIRPDEMPDKYGSILIPQTVKDQYKLAAESGIVICVGENAFMGYGDSHPWCEAGDRVRYSRYAGKYVEIPTDSKKYYQVINDEDIFYVEDGGE